MTQVGSARVIPGGFRRKPILEAAQRPRRRPAVVTPPPAPESAHLAAPAPAPPGAQAIQGEVVTLELPRLTLREKQQLKVLGDRAPRPLLAKAQACQGGSAALPAREARPFPTSDSDSAHLPCGAPISSLTLAARKKETEDKTDTYLSFSGSEKEKDTVGNIYPARECARAKTGRARYYNAPEKVPSRRAAVAERARQVFAARAAGTTTGAPAAASLFSPEAQVAFEYERCLGAYTGERALKFVCGDVAPGQPNWGVWRGAARAAESVGVSYAAYVRAQFWFFERWFSRRPKVRELLPSAKGKMPAQQRALAYVELVRQGAVDDTRDVVAKGQAQPKRDWSQRSDQSERTLAQLCRRWSMSPEDVFRNFTGPAAAALFDADWLAQHPAYRALRAAGEF